MQILHFQKGKLSRAILNKIAILIGLFLIVTKTMGADPLPLGFPQMQLPSNAKGEGAIAALGAKLPATAAFYGKTDQQLRDLLRKDHSLWVDKAGRLFYVCNLDGPDDVETASFSLNVAPFPLENTFALHSRPGATKIIYLDFDGHDASSTQWGSDAIGTPYDLDGSNSSFSTTERERIQYIWQRVSEDFAHYDVDVTTEEPGVEALRKANTSDANYGIRVVIGGSSTDWYNSSGGVAYLNSFDWNTDTPCWVFPESLSNSEKNIAEAISHEVGHTLSLSHDGKTDGTEYYGGHGNWAPIMGVGYSKPISQWSKGEYTDADNLEDDLTKMLNRGVSYRVDDYGNNIASAFSLAGISFSASGIIESRTDLDFFRFQTGAGKITLTATPFIRGANLHILLSLFDDAGNLIASTNTTDTTAGVLATSLTATVPTGVYYFSVDGVGSGDAASDGYSDYASIGQYTVNGTLPSGSGWLPTAGGNYSWIEMSNWASNTVPDSADVFARVNSNLVGDQTITLDKAITVGKLLLGDVNASHSFTLQDGANGSLTFDSVSGNAFIIKTNGLNDGITATMQLESSLVISNSSAGNLLLDGPMIGTGGLTKWGVGSLILDGAKNYGGPTILGAGQIVFGTTGSIDGSTIIDLRSGTTLDVAALAGGWTMRTNQMLSGMGTVVGNVTVPGGAKLSAGSNNIPGTLTFSNNLVINSGAILNVDLANSTTSGSNDLIVVSGDLALNSPVNVNFNFLDQFPLSPGTYTLMTYGGTLTGSATNFSTISSSRYTFVFDDSVSGEIRVHVSEVPGNIFWLGDGSLNRWDINSSSNWLKGGVPDRFYQLDSVIFDDSGFETPAINLIGVLQPNAVLVAGSKNYTFQGAGKISGFSSLTKEGSGTLTVSTTNDYSGLTTISSGTFRAGNASALGNVAGPTIVASGARLDINAQKLGAEPITVAGSGIGGTGVIINSSSTLQSNALSFVELSANTTFGGTGRWDIRANPTAKLIGNNFSLTKTGVNEIWLADTEVTGLADIIVNQGTLGFEGSTTLGNVTNTLTIGASANVSLLNNDLNLLNKKVVMNGGSLLNPAGNIALAGTITLNGNSTISSASIFDVQSAISGAAGLTKTGNGILTLTASNSFTGTLSVNAGTLKAGNTSALGETNGSTVVASNARLDINGINLGAELVTVQGDGLGNAGAIVNTGASQMNALRFVTLAAATTLGGTGRWDVRANPTGTFRGNNFTLTKRGINDIWLVDVGETGLGIITIAEGRLGFQGTSTLGTSTSTVSVSSAGELGIYNTGTNILSKVMTISGGSLYNQSGTNTFAGPTTLTSSNTFDIASGTRLIMAGTISSSGSLNKISSGTLIFTGTNSYSGLTEISAGTLQIGNAGATGTTGTGVITNRGTLAVNRTNDITVANTITGSGSVNQNGTGTLTLTGNNSFSGSTVLNAGALAVSHDSALGKSILNFVSNNGIFRSANTVTRTLTNEIIFGGATTILGLTNTGDLIFNGNGVNNGTLAKTLVISNASVTINNAITNRGTITKDGPGALTLGGNNTYTNTTTVLRGALRINAENRLGNNPATFNPTQLTLNGGTLQTTASFSIDDSNRGITLGSGGGTFNVNLTTTLTMVKPVAGAGSLIKTGGGGIMFFAANSFTGPTIINEGSLILIGSGSLVSPEIELANGATLNVASVNGGFVLQSPQTLSGIGNITGNVTANGTISPGTSSGRLAFNQSLTLNGLASMDSIKTGAMLTNDSLTVSNQLSFGGSLVVTHSGNNLQAGDTLRLFTASTFTGTFSSMTLPVLSSGLIWDTTQLAVNGIVRVMPSAPEILPPVLNGNQLSIPVQSQVGLTYVLETTPALELPFSWTPVSTNNGNGGVLNITISIDSPEPQKFFRLSVY